jgi:DNA-binding response OmpR family regulator
MEAARILLIERTRAQASFAEALKKRYDVVTVPSGKQALAAAQEQTPHVVVLDAISMKTTGDRIARQVKNALVQVPLIHLHPGPKADTENPAEAVLIPPFTSRKVINSIERLRSQVNAADLLTCGPIAVNLSRRILVANGQETQLTPKLAQLVETFLRHPGETLDRKMLMEQVWQTDYMGDTRTLDVHIRWFRRAIEADPGKPRYLITVRGVGYRLELPKT